VGAGGDRGRADLLTWQDGAFTRAPSATVLPRRPSGGRGAAGIPAAPLLVSVRCDGYRWMVLVFCEVAVQFGQLVLFPVATTT